MFYVLDTHPIVWFVSGSPRLTPVAQAAMSDPTAQLIVPAMALIEIRFLSARRRTPN
jgi:PIN domain nuclease of toxin-antitoxin system